MWETKAERGSRERKQRSARPWKRHVDDDTPMTDSLPLFFIQEEGKSVARANVCRVPVPVGASLDASFFVHAPPSGRA